MLLSRGCIAAREGPERETSGAAGFVPSALASVLDGGLSGGVAGCMCAHGMSDARGRLWVCCLEVCASVIPWV